MSAAQTRTLARFHLDLAHALYTARERAGLSVEDLAELAELAPNRIEMIEEGDTTSTSEVFSICEALKISPRSLFPEEADSVRVDVAV